MRVLQLIDSQADYDTRQAVRLLLRVGQGYDVAINSIGKGGDWRGPVDAYLKLRVRDIPHVVHAWGNRALLVAALTPHRRLFYTPTSDDFAGNARWARAVASHRELRVVVPTEYARRQLVIRGVPMDHITVIAPGVDFAGLPPRRDPELRRALGIAPGDRIYLAIGPSTRTSGHEAVTWAVSILAALDKRHRLLISGDGNLVGRLKQLMRGSKRDGMVIDAASRLGQPVDFEKLCSVADVAITAPPGQVPALSLATCMASGLPIIGTATYATSELIADRANALLVKEARSRIITRRLLDLEEDASLAWRIADTARADAYRMFSLSNYRSRHTALWRGEVVAE